MDENKVGLSYKCADNLSSPSLSTTATVQCWPQSHFPLFFVCGLRTLWRSSLFAIGCNREFATAMCLSFSVCSVSWT